MAAIVCPIPPFGFNKKSTPYGVLFLLEAPPGIGPGMKVLQTSALPLGYGAGQKTRDNRQLSLSVIQSSLVLFGADYGARTRHLDLGKVALYQMS